MSDPLSRSDDSVLDGEQARLGVSFAITAFMLAGLSAWFYKLIAYVPSFEIVAHRILWAVPVAAITLLVLGRTGDLRRAISTPRTIATLVVTASLVGLNWVLYILAVTGGFALEASLGFFINPLVSVLLGLVFLREKLLPAQWFSVALAGVAVAVQTVMVGALPWLALTLATTFALYGYLRKTVDIGPAQGFLIEVLLFLPVAATYLSWLYAHGQGSFGTDGFTTAWLVLAGPMTATPLILFAAAARRVQLATVGLLQYIAPSLVFLIAVFIFQEPLDTGRLACFALIWIALAIFSVSAVRGDRKRRLGAQLPG